VQSVTQLQLLQQLNTLTSLSASALADEGLSALAQLRRLRHLDIERSKGLTVPGISLLTAMVGLTELRGPALAAPFSASHHGRPIHLRSRTVRRGCQVGGRQGVLHERERLHLVALGMDAMPQLVCTADGQANLLVLPFSDLYAICIDLLRSGGTTAAHLNPAQSCLMCSPCVKPPAAGAQCQ
jgi:hypothetical protein